MTDSFSQLEKFGGSNRLVVVSRITVLVVACIAAVVAGIVALTRDDASSDASAPPETVTVTATPPERDFVPDSAPVGTFVGTLTSVEEDTAGRSWQAVATFGGETGMVVYPDQECVVSLTPLSRKTYRSTALTTSCSATDGFWQVHQPESGLVELVYEINGVPVVEGTLSLGVPVRPE
ncbi:hypothetical protein [Corynebacterium cystitidis]|uniref:hypothetical protein n=1 Tax=Corynebacterium cystitidis TaxID=35757 RepID=UPI00211ECE15|nr:hypothetical protein [Corynebacterium cystitidis]